MIRQKSLSSKSSETSPVISVREFVRLYVRELAPALDQGVPISQTELKDAFLRFEVLNEITVGNQVNQRALLAAISLVSEECGNLRNIFLVSFGMFLEATKSSQGSGNIVEDAYNEVISGSEFGAIAITGERNPHGENRATLTPTATGYLLSGEKAWVTLGMFAKYLLVSCFLGGERRLVLVDSRDKGVLVRPKGQLLGNRGSGIAEISFTDVIVSDAGILPNPKDPKLGLEGRLMGFARIAAAWSGLGLGSAALAHTANQLMSNNSSECQKQTLGMLISRRVILEGFLQQLSSEPVSAEPPSMNTAIAAKLVASEFARDAADCLASASGSRSYVESHVSSRIWREAQSFNHIEGSDTLLSRHLGNTALVEGAFG